MSSSCIIILSVLVGGLAIVTLMLLYSKRIFRFKSNNSSLQVAKSTQEYKMVILIRQDIEMSKGKIAAQCCHACLGAYQEALRNSQSKALKAWEAQGQPKITLRVKSEQEMLELRDKARFYSLVSVDVKDAGHTQVTPGTRTVLAIGPGPSTTIDCICGHLKLY